MEDLDQQDINYNAAKSDPIANIILSALRQQDTATYHGAVGDMGKRALDAAGKIRDAIFNG